MCVAVASNVCATYARAGVGVDVPEFSYVAAPISETKSDVLNESVICVSTNISVGVTLFPLVI